MKIALVATGQVDLIWPHVTAHLRKGCERVRRLDQSSHPWTVGELWRECRTGNAFLICAYEPEPWRVYMASAWRFEDEAFRCLMMGGEDMARWLEPAFEHVAMMARDNEAKRLVAEGRMGWQRVFPGAQQDGQDIEVAI